MTNNIFTENDNNEFTTFSEDNLQSLLLFNHIKSRSLYLTTLLVIIFCLSLLPVVKISLSVQGRGFIRPVTEKSIIKALKSEMVSSVCIKEGQYVRTGDTLVVLRQDILKSNISLFQQELKKKLIFKNDLNCLISDQPLQIKSNLFKEKYAVYKQKLTEINTRISRAEAEIDRNESLHTKEIISQKEYDDLCYNLLRLEKEKKLLKTNHKVQWKNDLEENESSVYEIKNRLTELIKQKHFFNITAPVSGTIEEFEGIYEGSTLHEGQIVAVISPESKKIAEIYVTGKDIGYLQKGQVSIIQVDAFDYNQWGAIKSKILSISDDYILIENKPFFKVKCQIETEYLQLKNGVKGFLKKGMTLNARFIISKRSLFQLLYQKSDSWLNPGQHLTINEDLYQEK